MFSEIKWIDVKKLPALSKGPDGEGRVVIEKVWPEIDGGRAPIKRDYAERINERLKEAGFRAEVDTRNEKIGYKIREAEMQKVPYMLIVGEKEQATGSASVRVHGEGDKGQRTIEEIMVEFAGLNDLERVAQQHIIAAHDADVPMPVTDPDAIEHAVPDAR